MSERVERKTEAAAVQDESQEERAAKKRSFRLAALAERDALTAEQRASYSGRIVKKLTSLPDYQNADAILTYVSFRSEVNTFLLMERAFADGKAVFAPKVVGKEMDFYQIFSVNDLTEGYRGILEPAGGHSFDVKSGIPSAMICMPGAAFDRKRHRIGYGGGFYDRYLSRIWGSGEETGGTERRRVKMTTAALAFDCQLFETIPWAAHDICPERIVTETEMI